MKPLQTMEVAVLMARRPTQGPNARWQSHAWHLQDVVAHDASMGSVPQCIQDDADAQVWLHPGYAVELFRDGAEGYHLNLAAPTPCFFVLWRMEDEPSLSTECMAKPEIVTLSYHDAGRWLDAQERVDQVPAPREVLDWLAEFTAQHYAPEVKRRKRPESFKSLQDRFGNPVRVSVGKS
jgi:hypothetical protein